MDTTRLIIVAVGGQGNLLASKVLGEAALISNIPVRMSEIHGMAQRGGVVESAVVFGNAKSSIISDGEADVLMGFEPSETLRAINKCNSNTVVITSLSCLPPFTVALGKSVYPDLNKLQDLIRSKTKHLIAFNAADLAQRAGNILSVNIVLLGALIQTGILPLSTDSVKEAIKTKTKKTFVESNLKAFEIGFAVAKEFG
ncbi:MAG: indolepyruvate oxidoreductase subunit beta [Proteobacteria bacterium]|nr:indolepyruvate oxidoreductase subunit beta [Pseudomonadota bacterium]MBU4462418.1 indolepyruvate oxidoreductase subunit beta [Pseudomonadota bacterium]